MPMMLGMNALRRQPVAINKPPQQIATLAEYLFITMLATGAESIRVYMFLSELNVN